MPSKAVAEFLAQEEGAGALIARARLLNSLGRAIDPVVPAPLRHLYRVANFKQDALLLFTANNAVAAKLRLLSPAFLQACLERGTAVRELKIEVQPAAFAPAAQAKKRAFLSGNAKQALKKLEGTLREGELRTRIRALTNKDV